MSYQNIIVESFYASGPVHGPIHIRPIKGQDPYLPTMHVECSKVLSYDYPVGTRFRINAKLKRREGGSPFVYSHYSWPYTVLEE